MSTAMLESRSPQRPADVLATFADTDASGVDAALQAGRRAQRKWERLAAGARAQALVAAADAVEAAAAELAELGIREVGKPRGEMVGEVARGVAILRYYAQAVLDPDGDVLPSPDGRSLLLARHRPHGVAGLVTPWNFPVAIPLWKAAPALAYGNAVVLKPSPASTATALRLAEVLSPCLPGGLFQVVTGDRAAGEALISEADVVSFTGSVAVGRQVALKATERGIPVQAELGGQNPSVVLEDADLEGAAGAIAQAAMSYAGQKCTATSRVIVVGNADRFAEALVGAVEALPLGDPAEAATVVGPVIGEGARRAVLEAVHESKDAGGTILTGGDSPERDGYYVRPTLVAGVEPSHRLAQEEVFGPIAAVLAARDEEDALRIANGVRYGLAAAVFTTDLDRALRVVHRLQAGLVRVNAPTSGVDYFAPFGGTKASSIGPREQGKAAREHYSWIQTVTVSPARAGSAR